VLLQPPTSFKSFAVEDRPGEQWVRLCAAHRGTEEAIKIDATLFDGAAEPGPDAPLFNRVNNAGRRSSSKRAGRVLDEAF
jgi:hypothetical protein